MRYTTVDGAEDEREDDGVDDKVRYTTVDEKVTLSALPQGNPTDRSDDYRKVLLEVNIAFYSYNVVALLRLLRVPCRLSPGFYWLYFYLIKFQAS